MADLRAVGVQVGSPADAIPAPSPADAIPAIGSDEPRLLPARWWHVAELVELEGELFPTDPWTVEMFVAELAADGRSLQVALDDRGRVRGYVDVAVSGRDAELMTIAVAAAKAGRGWGGTLLEWAVRHAEAAGADRMFLEVRSGNRAEALYRRAGFEPIDLRRGYYADGGDAVVMVKALGSGSGSGSGRPEDGRVLDA